MNIGLIIGLIIITIIIVIIVIIILNKNKNKDNSSTSETNQQTQLYEDKSKSETIELSTKTNSNSNSNSIKPEDIVSENINAPKELSQAELLKAEIMKEVLQDQKADFDKSLENEMNFSNYITNDINKYFDKWGTPRDTSFKTIINGKYELITFNNIMPFKFIIPSYNPTNGAHFIYCMTYWILKDKYSEFEKVLNEVLEEIKLTNDVIEIVLDDNSEINAGYILFKTYTNTSTPSYQYERINKNLKKKFDILYLVDKNFMDDDQLPADDNSLRNVYTYQGNINDYIIKFEKAKIKKVNIKLFNVDGYEVDLYEIDDLINK